MTTETANADVRLPYEAPSVRDLGSIAEVTRGAAGTATDVLVASV